MGRGAYQRQYMQDRYDEYKARRAALAASAFGNKCFLCPAPYSEGRPGFHLHHVEYHPEESDYPRNGKSFALRVKRLEEAEAHPERFRLLCARCHRVLEGIIALLGEDTDWDMILSCIPAS